jgi:hypothetical protein
VLGQGQHLAGQGAGQGPAAAKILSVQELADISAGEVRAGVRRLFEEVQGSEVGFAVQQPGPKLHRASQVGPVRMIGGEIAQGGIRDKGGLIGLARPVSNQRPMPIYLVRADPQGRKLEAVAKQATLFDLMGGLLNLFGACPGAVEEQVKIVRPNLDVPGHGLVVQSQVVGDSAKKDVQKFILSFQECQLVLVPKNACPAVGALVGIANGPVVVAESGLAGPRLMKPAGLRDADAARMFVPIDQMEQRDLHRQGQLLLEPEKRGRRPEQ